MEDAVEDIEKFVAEWEGSRNFTYMCVVRGRKAQ